MFATARAHHGIHGDGRDDAQRTPSGAIAMFLAAHATNTTITPRNLKLFRRLEASSDATQVWTAINYMRIVRTIADASQMAMSYFDPSQHPCTAKCGQLSSLCGAEHVVSRSRAPYARSDSV